MKWIITGGAGFIGCHAAARFLQLGHQVVLVDNLSRQGTAVNLAWLRDQGLRTFVRADVRDSGVLERTFREHGDADAVLHLAAQAAVTTSVEDPRVDFEVNALGTFNVLEAIRNGARRPVLLYSSTNKVYGALEHLETAEKNGRYTLVNRPAGITEEEPLDFQSPYGCSKGCGDQYVRDYARIYGLPTVVFRQSCIYGTRQFGVEDQGWIAWFCIAAVTGQPLILYGNGKQVRDALWIDDLIDLYLAAVAHIPKVQGQVLNVGGGPENSLSLLELLTWLEKALERSLQPGYADYRPGDQRVFIANLRKAEGLLGWKPKVSLAEGLKRLLAWVKENRGLFA